MFNFIHGMFDKSATTSDMTWNVPVFASEYEWDSIGSPYLSQSELQMLQRLVAERIQAEDTSRRSAIDIAKVYPNDYDTQDYWYRLANKASVKISKLAKLQYRLKHKIAAKG